MERHFPIDRHLVLHVLEFRESEWALWIGRQSVDHATDTLRICRN
jgi:hypothetical protein